VYPLIEGRAPEPRTRRVFSPGNATAQSERRQELPHAETASGTGIQS